MKKINLILVGLAFLGFSACEKETTEGLSRVTNYPIIEVAGDATVFVPQGGTFTDPGVSATEEGQSIPVTTSASGVYRGGATLDPNVADRYNVTYTATNKDGFNGTSTRSVWVYNTGDLVNSIEGLYVSTVARNGSSPPAYQNMKYILIWKNADGTYELSCGFGGWYEYGRALGPGFVSPGGIITANDIATNDFTFGPTFTNSYFGGTVDITDVNVDPVAKTITVTADWSFGFTFVSTLTQVTP